MLLWLFQFLLYNIFLRLIPSMCFQFPVTPVLSACVFSSKVLDFMPSLLHLCSLVWVFSRFLRYSGIHSNNFFYHLLSLNLLACWNHINCLFSTMSNVLFYMTILFVTNSFLIYYILIAYICNFSSSNPFLSPIEHETINLLNR